MKRYVRANTESITLDEVYNILSEYDGNWTNPKNGWTGECEIYQRDLEDGNYLFSLVFGGDDSEPDQVMFCPNGSSSNGAIFTIMPYHGEFQWANTLDELRRALRKEYSYLRKVNASMKSRGRKITASEDFDSMTWEQFKKTYKDTLKKYPDIGDLYGRNYTITLTTENYEKQGSRWTLVDSETQTIPFEYYMNAIDASPFFKNLGGKESISKSYTIAGYIPVEIRSTSPDGRQKTIRKYKFS